MSYRKQPAGILSLFLGVLFMSAVNPALAGVISAGGNTASGGDYVNFSVVGESFGGSSLTGGEFSSRLGFLPAVSAPPLDSDNDGLPDFLENDCPSPFDADSDDDGILDGHEDVNANGQVDPGETDPCNPDSDGDFIQDGTELGFTGEDIGPDTDEEIFQPDLDPDETTDPLNPDTDGDGWPDGDEDSNFNGRTDEGESDPNILDLPEMVVRQAGTSIALGSLFDFGVVAAGESLTRSFVIANSGNEPLLLTSSPPVQLGDGESGFGVSLQPPVVVESNSDTFFDITFSPDDGEMRLVQVEIANNDIDENPYFFFVRGNYQPLTGWSRTGILPDTGQVQSYTETFGEDADYAINPQSYTKLDATGAELPENATAWAMVRDNVTGLIWEAKTDDDSLHDRDNRYSWYDPDPVTNGGDAGLDGAGTDTADFLDALNGGIFGGFSDWRLPTIHELSYILDRARANPAVDPLIFADINQQSSISYYWSSTTSAADTERAWMTDFFSGHNYRGLKTTSNFVRAVRGGWHRMAAQFLTNGDGTVTDTGSGLMWQREIPTYMTWEEAISYCENLELAGFTDWRLPNRNELLSLRDYTQLPPSIDNTIFPGVYSTFFWSSTTDALDSDYALGMIYTDTILDALKSWNSYLRAVRGGQHVQAGHLRILEPRQGGVWQAESQVTIRWETAGITGGVGITLSRLGGRPGTFETIVDETANDGEYAWTVSGPGSINCLLRIEPLTEPELGSGQGLFSIIKICAGDLDGDGDVDGRDLAGFDAAAGEDIGVMAGGFGCLASP